MRAAAKPRVAPAPEPGQDTLARINEREREIERIIAEARQAATGTVEEARRTAAAILASQREEAAREAAQVRGAVVDQARREAEAILAAGRREAAAFRALPRERIEQAGERLVALILEGTGRGEGGA